jgi:hypothetical protein
MPAARPTEFRRRAVELARLREKPIALIATIWGSTSRVCAGGCRLASVLPLMVHGLSDCPRTIHERSRTARHAGALDG